MGKISTVHREDGKTCCKAAVRTMFSTSPRPYCLILFSIFATNTVSAIQKTHSFVRFVDEADGEIRRGAFVGGQKARLLQDFPDGNTAVTNFGPWAVSNEERTIRKLLAPIDQPPAIYAIGLNYWGHINATNLTAPENPSLFFKNTMAFNIPFGDIIIPPISSKPDWEGELGLVIGPKDCLDVVSEDAVEQCVLGYTLCHDVSARCYQGYADDDPDTGDHCPGNGGQFSWSKSFDTHAPLGPSLISPSALASIDGKGLHLTTKVNGIQMQNETTSSLIFGVRSILSFLSQGMTLPAGSVICTGTPDGVGATMDPPQFLQDGDEVEINIPEIGSLVNNIVRPTQEEYSKRKQAARFTVSKDFGSLEQFVPVSKIVDQRD